VSGAGRLGLAPRSGRGNSAVLRPSGPGASRWRFGPRRLVRALARARKSLRGHANAVAMSISGDEDPPPAPEVQVMWSVAAADVEAARRRITVIGGETEVPGGGRALTSHSSGRGASAGALFSGADGIRGGVAPAA
jgi:hypothetical protein